MASGDRVHFTVRNARLCFQARDLAAGGTDRSMWIVGYAVEDYTLFQVTVLRSTENLPWYVGSGHLPTYLFYRFGSTESTFLAGGRLPFSALLSTLRSIQHHQPWLGLEGRHLILLHDSIGNCH